MDRSEKRTKHTKNSKIAGMFECLPISPRSRPSRSDLRSGRQRSNPNSAESNDDSSPPTPSSFPKQIDDDEQILRRQKRGRERTRSETKKSKPSRSSQKKSTYKCSLCGLIKNNHECLFPDNTSPARRKRKAQQRKLQQHGKDKHRDRDLKSELTPPPPGVTNSRSCPSRSHGILSPLLPESKIHSETLVDPEQAQLRSAQNLGEAIWRQLDHSNVITTLTRLFSSSFSSPPSSSSSSTPLSSPSSTPSSSPSSSPACTRSSGAAASESSGTFVAHNWTANPLKVIHVLSTARKRPPPEEEKGQEKDISETTIEGCVAHVCTAVKRAVFQHWEQHCQDQAAKRLVSASLLTCRVCQRSANEFSILIPCGHVACSPCLDLSTCCPECNCKPFARKELGVI